MQKSDEIDELNRLKNSKINYIVNDFQRLTGNTQLHQERGKKNDISRVTYKVPSNGRVSIGIQVYIFVTRNIVKYFLMEIILNHFIISTCLILT